MLHLLKFFLFASHIANVYGDINSNLLAYWSFDGNTNDNTGNGNDATNNGATAAIDRFGNANSAFSFDGNDFMTVNNVNLDIGSSSVTVAAWIKTTGSSSGRIFSKGSSAGSTGYQFRTSGLYPPGTPYNERVYLEASFGNNIILELVGNSIINDNNWHCVAGVIDSISGFGYVYVDGVLDNSQSLTTTNYDLTNARTPNIGRNDVTNSIERFVGSIDEVRVYDRALSETDVSEYCNYVATTTTTTIIPTTTEIETTCDSLNDISCYISGDPHFTQWDGSRHHFQGIGYYDYIIPCNENNDIIPFKISGKQDICPGGCCSPYTCIIEIYVTLSDNTIIVFPGNGDPTFLSNGNSAIGTNVIFNGGIYTAQSGLFSGTFIDTYNLNTSVTISFTLNGNNFYSTTSSDCLKNRLCGICGNINFNKNDDFEKKDGIILDNTGSDKWLMPTIVWENTFKFGDSWCNNNINNLNENENYNCLIPTPIPTQPPINCLNTGIEYCTILYNSFCNNNCFINNFNFIDWLEDCKFDSCISSQLTLQNYKYNDALVNGFFSLSLQSCQSICQFTQPAETFGLILDGTSDIIVESGNVFEINCEEVDGCENINLYCDGECIIICDEANGISCPNVLCSANNGGTTVFSVDCVSPTESPIVEPTEGPIPSPTSSPTENNNNNECPVLTTCASSFCEGDGENPNCADQRFWGCVQCQDNYWFLSFQYPCVECSIIDHCLTCESWAGCSVCEPGYWSTYSEQCGFNICQ